jgi:hypothetical protein
MPHFFMLENNSSDEEIRRTRQEARAITEYLVETATPLTNEVEVPTDAKGEAKDGQKLFTSIGCLGCHANLNETGEKWITTDLVKRAGYKQPDAKKAYEEMTYNQRQLYALEHLAAPEGGSTEVCGWLAQAAVHSRRPGAQRDRHEADRRPHARAGEGVAVRLAQGPAALQRVHADAVPAPLRPAGDGSARIPARAEADDPKQG